MPSLTSPKLTIILYCAVIIFIAFGGMTLYLSRPEPAIITINPPAPTATEAPSATPGPILVYVTGAVQLPETTHSLPYGSRVSDAIEASGGFTEQANKSLVNLAGILRDGDQIHVPSTGAFEGITTLPTASGGNKIRINQASESELQALPGVGPALAGSILRYRTEHGPFKRLDELDNVSGIGPATLSKWRDLIVFD